MQGQDHQTTSPGHGADYFVTTHWSVVQAAGRHTPQTRSALEALCRTYWYPLYAYVRRCGEKPEDSQDLTQEFFARFLEKDSLKGATPTRGRFRWFLLASFKHFLANEWDRARAQKRGGARRLISFDQLDPEQRYGLEPADDLSADRIYDRAWALMLLDKARARLREEFSAAARVERFESLEQFLPGEAGSATYSEIATRLGVAEGTVKSEVSRLRRRYGEVVREELARTMGSQTDVDAELHHLLDALSRPA